MTSQLLLHPHPNIRSCAQETRLFPPLSCLSKGNWETSKFLKLHSTFYRNKGLVHRLRICREHERVRDKMNIRIE